MILPTVISLIFRLLFRRSSLPPSKTSVAIYLVTFFPVFFLSNYLIKIGNPRRDPTTGTLISYGEDLSQPGVMEWCFDILYITCMCCSSLTSSLWRVYPRGMSSWKWCVRWMVLVAVYDCEFFPRHPTSFKLISIVKIPLFAVFKLWTSVISPLVLGRGSSASVDDTQEKGPATSKRQEKLRKRQEKGDPRVRAQSGKK